MSNSALITYTQLSPNHSGKRTMPIDRITPHCVVGQLTAAGICGCFTSSSVQASCNYGIGKNGDIALCVEEKNRSWCSSSNANDQRAVTIECACDKTHPYAFTDKCYQSLIELCADICRRNGKTKLIWFGDKNKTLNYQPASNEMILTVHRWFANKACPGDWLYSRMGDLAKKVNEKLGSSSSSSTSTTPTYYRVRKSWEAAKSQLGAYESLENAKKNCPVGYNVYDSNGKVVYSNVATVIGTQTSEFTNLSETASAAKLLEIAKTIAESYGLFPSVLAAQAILESGYCKTELAKKANNILGMKSSLLNNTWTSPVWNGESVTIATTEYYNGVKTTIYDQFRKYACIEDCMKDRCTFFTQAKVSTSATQIKYHGIKECKNYKEQIQLIKDRGYATDPEYVTKVCNIIEKYKLAKYDKSTSPASDTYFVGTGWSNGKCQNQHNSFSVLDNAKKDADTARTSNKKTYYVFDSKGAVIYTANYTTPVSTSATTQYIVQAGVYSVKANAVTQYKKIRAAGFDAALVQSGSQWLVRCGIFSIKKNAENLQKRLASAGFAAIIKVVKGNTTTTTVKVNKVVNKAKELAKVMITEKWTYSNSGNKLNWGDAHKASRKVSNCALFASHVLQETGYLNKNQTFYFSESGKVVSRQKGWERLKETCTITTYSGVSVKELKLTKGDIVCYAGHVNIFAGYNAKKVPTWIDAGRRGTKDCKADSPFTSKMFDTSWMNGFKVYAVVRPH